MNGSLLSSRLFRMLAVILVIFLGILIGLPYLIKQQARMWLEDNGGDRVEIRDVDFNPFTAELVLDDLLVEVEDRQPLHFDTARLELEWLPLLEKHIDVKAVELQGFYMLINNEDILRVGGILLPPRASEPENQEAAGEASAWLAGVDTLTLKDFTLVYHDAALDQRVYIDSLELSDLTQWNPEVPARLEYRGAVNDAAVELDAELAPFAQTPNYKATVSVDKLALADFEPLAKPALAKLAGLVSVHGDFEIEQRGDDIHVLNRGELKVEEIGIDQAQIHLTNQALGWDGSIDLTFNTASSQTHVKTEGKLKVADINVQHEQVRLANQSLDWDGIMDLSLDTASSQTHARTEGKLKVADINVQHALVLLTNQSLDWDGATDLTLDTASSQAGVESKGKLTSTGLATDPQEQKLKLEYQNLDLDIVFSYAGSESGTDIVLNSDLRVSGLDLFAPEKKVDIISAERLQLAGLEIKGPEHVSAKNITAEQLSLGRSLNEQEVTSEDEKRAMFYGKQVAISNFSHIDGFTAIDTIAEDDVQVVYHRDKEGKWNVVTLLNALAGEQSNAVETEASESGKKTPDATGTAGKEEVAGQSSANGEPEAAAGPPPWQLTASMFPRAARQPFTMNSLPRLSRRH